MNFWSNIAINVYSMIILIIIYIQSVNDIEREFLNHKLFMYMVQITFLMLAVDIFSRFDGQAYAIYYLINHSANFLIFMLSPILPSLWFLYVHYQIFKHKLKIRKLVYPLLLINALNIVMVVFTQFYGWYYYIDPNNIYHRGPLYWIGPAVAVALIFVTYILIFIYRNRIAEKNYFALAFFVVPPLVGITLQSIFYGISIVLNSIVISLIILLLNNQNRSIYIDYLTGLNNRKKIEIYLKNKVDLCDKDKTFSAIMLDLNDFKAINDTYGHDVGDSALKVSANILKSCIRGKDFIGRFGGDEFLIVMELSDRLIIEGVISRIRKCFLEYNEDSNQPYFLSASMGYDVYDCDSNMTAEEFVKHIDRLMYKDKQMSKKTNIPEIRLE